MVNNPELINKLINNINKLDDEIIKEAIREVEKEDMEDIELIIIEEFIKDVKELSDEEQYTIFGSSEMTIREPIENLLKRYKELEEEVESQDKTIDKLVEEQEEREKYTHSLEEENKHRLSQVDFLSKEYDIMFDTINNLDFYIDDLIKECKEGIERLDGDDCDTEIRFETEIEVLQRIKDKLSNNDFKYKTSIPISVIQNKIDELDKRIDYLNTELTKCYIEREKLGTETDIDNNETAIFCMEQEREYRHEQKQVLQELLEERNK